MIQSKQPLAQSIIQLCKSHNIQTYCDFTRESKCPLTIGFTNHDFFECYSIVDERSAGFFALGMAQQLQQPVALVCTSGSALVNYYPAVTEAFYSRVPLVVISADRPEHLINIGDGQTITQPHVFGAHILYEANLKEHFKKSFLKAIKNNDSLLKRHFIFQNRRWACPYQCAFCGTFIRYHEEFTSESNPTKIKINNPSFSLSKTDLKKWHSSKRKMILVGVNPPNSVQEIYLKLIAEDPSVIVLTETTSNLHHPEFFRQYRSINSPFGCNGF